MIFKLGNLLPGQNATLKSTILSQLEIIGGHYCFSLPAAFFPDYKKHGINKKDTYAYEFVYEVEILANSPISNLSIPVYASVASQNEDHSQILIRCSQPGRIVDLYYRTFDMMHPQLQFARNSDNEIAVSVSLAPTFDPK